MTSVLQESLSKGLHLDEGKEQSGNTRELASGQMVEVVQDGSGEMFECKVVSA